MYRPYTTITKRPSEIRFSQDSIHHKFCRRSGHSRDSVNETLDKILSWQLSATDLPRIDVAEKDGELYTLGNRRLYIFRVLELKGKLDTIPVHIVSSFGQQRLTTINDGVSIVMRNGGGTRDHAHATPIPKAKEIVDKLLDELLLQVINSAGQHTTNEAGTSIGASFSWSGLSKATSTDAVENGGDAIKTDGAISESSEGVVTTDHDVIISSDVVAVDAAVNEVCSDVNESFDDVNKPDNLSGDDVESQDDDVETQDDDVVTKVDDVEIKTGDVETQNDDVETKDDDVVTKVDDVVTEDDDVETKDVIPSFDSDANVFTDEINRISSQLADTASASEPEAKRSKT
ncbi:uncharacterized protein LOC100175021 isoform X2 [Ciona intestinalis]